MHAAAWDQDIRLSGEPASGVLQRSTDVPANNTRAGRCFGGGRIVLNSPCAETTQLMCGADQPMRARCRTGATPLPEAATKAAEYPACPASDAPRMALLGPLPGKGTAFAFGGGVARGFPAVPAQSGGVSWLPQPSLCSTLPPPP